MGCESTHFSPFGPLCRRFALTPPRPPSSSPQPGGVSMSRLDNCYNVYDLRAAAKRRLPKAVFEFVDRSTEDEIALRNNRLAFEKIKLKHPALVDVSGRPTKT